MTCDVTVVATECRRGGEGSWFWATCGRETADASAAWGASLIRNRLPLGPYSRTIPRALGGAQGGVRFLTGEVPLYSEASIACRRAVFWMSLIVEVWILDEMQT